MEHGIILEQARQGDQEAFYSLIVLHKTQMYKIAYSYFGNEQDALDAIQETVCRAYHSFFKLKQPEYFKTWLIRILINYCIDQKRRMKKTTAIVQDLEAEAYDNSDDKILLRQAMQNLSPKYRSIIILKYFEDLTLKEIADIMGKPVGTIKTWLNKALKELRLELREEEFGDV